jgi:CheY-like chemotaxis protein
VHLETVLERSGAVVVPCLSAKAALMHILNGDVFNVIISDLNMPNLDGFDMIHAVRDIQNSDCVQKLTPAIALSVNADEANSKKRFADFQVYMMKPYSNDHLVCVVESLAEADGDAVRAGSLEQLRLNRLATSN